MNGNYVNDGWYYSIHSYPPYSERNPIEYAKRAMAWVFFFSDKSTQIDGIWTNGRLVDEIVYSSIEEEGAPVSQGLRFYENNPLDRIIYFFTRDGVYLGQAFIASTE